MTFFYRHIVLLSVLEAFGGNLTAKKFQKLLFLFVDRQSLEKPLYEFAPYLYGCFSFSANKDMVALEKNGFIKVVDCEQKEKIYSLNSAGYISHLDLFDRETLEKTKKRFGSMTQDELIRYVYQNYPFFAVRSKIAEQILNKDDIVKLNRYKSALEKSSPMLFTIGYEGVSLEKYITILIKNDIRVLVDVRKNAFSMKYGFSKPILSKACDAVGISYIHIPELGIENGERQELKSQEDYDRLFSRYEQTTLKDNWSHLLRLREIVDSGFRVALTCFEHDPRQCHRTRVANALMTLPNINYSYKAL